MPVDIMCVKKGGMVFPVTELDRELFKAIPQNQVVKVSLVRQSNRALKHHQLYWTGLIGLIEMYWAPEPGCMSPTEAAIVKSFARFLGQYAENKAVLNTAAEDYITYVKRIRAEKSSLYQEPLSYKQCIHDWIKEELGMYEQYLTPTGWKKRLKSINFNAMPGQFEFMIFYTGAFNVAWSFILSHKFSNEKEATNAINQLMSM